MVRNHTNDKLKISGIVMTLVDGRTNLAKEVIDTIRMKYGMQIRIFDTQIPVAVKAAESMVAFLSSHSIRLCRISLRLQIWRNLCGISSWSLLLNSAKCLI